MSHDSPADISARAFLAPADAARLVANICEIVHQKLPGVPNSVMELTRIFDMGADAYEEANHTERFDVAIEIFIDDKKGLRPASFRDYKSVLGRIIRMSPEMAARPVRSIRAKDCIAMITNAYKTAASLDKARRLLHCFFAFAMRQNWCGDNPIARLQVYRRNEVMISVLNLAEIARLLETVARSEHRPCAAAVGIMLWTGLRPTEVTRLRWSEVDLRDRVVRVLPRVSKTGGARIVKIEPVLLQWLKRFAPATQDDACVAPGNWTRRWQRLRQDAGLNPWRADALRHTFASYHLRQFGDIHRLQLEMGHSSAHLLFCRYLNMAHVTQESAEAFWCMHRTSRSGRKK